MSRSLMIIVFSLGWLAPVAAWAGVASKAVQEAAEFVLRKGGQEAAEMGLETLARKIETLSLKYGDEALLAVKKAGPKTFRVVDEAGENGLVALKLLARHGDDALSIAAKPARLALCARYGDDAAAALLKHGEIAAPLIESLGKPATTALAALSTRNGRRLAILADEGALQQIGRSDELLAVVGKFGDRAMDFIWRNKGALATGAALTAFLANPQPFIDGTLDLTKAVSEKVIQPVATQVAKNADWTFVLPVFVAAGAAIIALKIWLRHRLTALAARGATHSVP